MKLVLTAELLALGSRTNKHFNDTFGKPTLKESAT